MKRQLIHVFVILFIGHTLFPSLLLSDDSAGQTQEYSLGLDDDLPVDPKIKIGKLDNGFAYYIRVNKKPENRAELRLVVNAGSVLEDDDQQGLAHFCEHMAFNGTEHFAKQELIDFLESIGMRFGPEINAYTGFDQTVYMLEVPSDSTVLMETAFQVLEDWAHLVAYEDDEIDKERGVIIEEWRQGRGAGARMLDKQLPILFKGSKYAERLVIGKKAVIDTCHYETLRQFYRDWYRPDLMAVVAVGDFDGDRIEALIKQHFSTIPLADNRRTRTLIAVPDHEETLFAIATDPEASSTSIGLYFKHPLQTEKSVADYRRLIMENFYDSMLNQRFRELTRQSDPPFLYGYSGKGSFVRSKGVYTLGAGVEDDGVLRGLDALLTEALRVKRFGFTQAELERTKKEMLRNMELAYNERDKTRSGTLVGELVRNYLEGEPIPGIEIEYELYKRFVPGIQLQELNRLADEWITDSNRVIMVNGPEKEGVDIPNEQELLAVFESVEQKELTPYYEEVSDEPLMASLPEPGKVVEEKIHAAIDVTEWRLSNGVRVVLKPTDFKNDEIRFTAFSPGGNSLVPDDDYIAAITSPFIISESGIGVFDKIELEKKLAGKVAGVGPSIGTLTEGMSGGCSPQDVETLFQLIALFFTSPRKDSSAFLSYKTRIRGYIENRSNRPEAAFQDTISVTMASYHSRSRPWSLELLDEMDLERSLDIYRDRFGDASDFTFVFVGNFDLDQMEVHIERYLGGLPVLNRNETWEDLGIELPAGVIQKVIRKGVEPKGQVELIFSGPYEWSRQNNYEMMSMTSALEIKLREVLREELGGTYGVDISASRSRYPREEYQIGIGFGCSPDRVDELTSRVLTQIDSVQQFGLDENYINKVQEAQRRQFETQLKENAFWLSALYIAYFHERDPENILTFGKLVDGLSMEAVQKAARQYFNMENYVQVVLLPEND